MRYPGGKGRCFQHIISVMPPHRVYIETHLGGGAVLRNKKPAESTIGIDLDQSVIAWWKQPRWSNVDLIHGDAVEFLRQFPFCGDEFVYSDPPYLVETRRKARIYRHDYTIEQHIELLQVLRGLRCSVIVSGYWSTLYADHLRDWNAFTFVGDSHVGPRAEVIWFNYEPPTSLHDYSYLGEDFREREAIRRRRTGAVRRISMLPPLERNALFGDLVARHSSEIEMALRSHKAVDTRGNDDRGVFDGR